MWILELDNLGAILGPNNTWKMFILPGKGSTLDAVAFFKKNFAVREQSLLKSNNLK